MPLLTESFIYCWTFGFVSVFCYDAKKKKYWIFIFLIFDYISEYLLRIYRRGITMSKTINIFRHLIHMIRWPLKKKLRRFPIYQQCMCVYLLRPFQAGHHSCRISGKLLGGQCYFLALTCIKKTPDNSFTNISSFLNHLFAYLYMKA